MRKREDVYIPPFQIEIDKIDRNGWDQLIAQFDDASIYQTWSWGVSKRRRVSHIVLREGDEILGCCQIRLLQLPFYHTGIADINWGPLCMNKGGVFKPEALLCLMRAVKEEYAIRRGYFLRIWPHVKGERKELLKQILEAEGFKKNPSEKPYRTLILDLSPSPEDLRKNLLQKWRNCLNKAEKNGLGVVEGTNDDLYKIFLMLAKEMRSRKDFAQHVDYQEYGRIQKDLPKPLKMKIMVCKAGNEPACAAICSAIGDTGIYLLGATRNKGLQLNGSYLLQWRIIQWLKETGIRYYDLGAFDPQLNPGVYHFKLGIAGDRGREETLLGEYRGCFNLSGWTGKLLLCCFKFLRRFALLRKVI